MSIFFCHNDDKYVSLDFYVYWWFYVLMKNIFIGFRSSSMKRCNDCPFRVLVCVDSIVLTGFVQRRRCLVELWCWRDYELVPIWFLLCFFFFFIFAYWRLFSFCPVEMKMGWWLCFGSVILSENHESGFMDWRYEFFSYGIVLLDAYLDSTWLVYPNVARKG